MKYLFLLLMLVPLMIKGQREFDYADSEIRASRFWLDLDYVGDWQIGHRLDIFLPEAEKEKYPVVICIYGSAWFSNFSKSASFDTGIGQYLLKNGFAVVNINHRSSNDAKFPAQIQDVKAAIRFIRNYANTFSLDSRFIGVTGWSSGGHLATLAGVTSGLKTYVVAGAEVELIGNPTTFPMPSSDVDAVVTWYGPTDFLIMDDCGSDMVHNNPESPESALIGGNIQDHPQLCARTNPINYIRGDNPPFLIFHGDNDPLVPHCQSEKLVERLNEEGVENRFVLIEGGKHGPGVMIDRYYQEMVDFFNSIVAKKIED